MANTTHSDIGSQAAGTNAQGLYQEVEQLRLTNQLLWALLADISRKMQVSSAAIKASVSSLLGYDIVLGTAAQHELLEVIENSTDQVSKNITLLTLVSQIEADTFVVNLEPIDISEVLFAASETLTKNHPAAKPGLTIHPSDALACVDYEYLYIALVMLYELLIQTQQTPRLNTTAIEQENHWVIDIDGTSQGVGQSLLEVSTKGPNDFLQGSTYLLPIRKLQLYVVYKILERLSVQLSILPATDAEGVISIQLIIPLAEASDRPSNCE